MTIYKYPASEKEEIAVKYLKDKGWKVDPPPCPDCKGRGIIAPIDVYWNPEHNRQRMAALSKRL